MQNQSTKQSFMLGRAHKIMCPDLNCKIQNEKRTAKEFAQIHSFREGEDSAGGFGLERTGKINSRII